MDEATNLKIPTKPIERVTISEKLKSKLQVLTDHANEALLGLATVTKTDVVNMMLSLHSETLDKAEIEVLRTEHFDEVRFSQWITERLKEARGSGETVSIMELIKRSKDLLESPERRPKKRRKVKSDPECPNSDSK